MLLHLASWPEIEAYLTRSSAILIPIGSTEQHGPNGLIGTDALCPEVIGRRAGAEAGFLIGPTFNVGMAQHHMAFPGSMTLRPATMIAAIEDWTASLVRHGFDRIFWLNGHGGNIATIGAAFSQIYAGYSLTGGSGNQAAPKLHLRNWWELKGVGELCKELFPVGEGSHATASEVSVTYAAFPQAVKNVAMSPKIAPSGGFRDAQDYRRKFPDGRIGSDPSQANPEKGERIIATAAAALIAEFAEFAAG